MSNPDLKKGNPFLKKGHPDLKKENPVLKGTPGSSKYEFFLKVVPKRGHLGAKMLPEGILRGLEASPILDLMFREHVRKSFSFTRFGSRSEFESGSS